MISEMLRKLICWEDAEEFLIIGTTEDGKITVSDYEMRWEHVGDTFEEALKSYYDAHSYEEE